MASVEKVRCAHILLKHVQSRNPINRNTNTPVHRTKEEARDELGALLDRIKSSPRPDYEFKTLALDISECSSARKHGDLGYFDRKTMQKPFSDAAFALNVGEISDLVETDSGIHIIYRIA
ncbi:bifunctional Peptidyl-prolyl cis-trans isomerase [Babesia duncani]|uniref:Peptidyl-prolyl cis-trans isomerase n=1 Tax=Babesia duncani TaxID=323732 RepID=A0AAD9PMG5_9APIC|nr:bifunctional Peptidyl-prolyl cis-trans isomerase [Babesia duncani]